MELDLPAGRYVVAVSGGVDSMALLHWLVQTHQHELIVAHFDHGIRSDSVVDRDLVVATARRYNLPVITVAGELGPHASEATARVARYAFLRQVQQDTMAQAIITAHHQDDVLETMMLNLLRGTNRKGLSPFQTMPDIKRPLTAVPKTELYDYARQHQLQWREDSTNTSLAYKRNIVRQQLLPKLRPAERQQWLELNQRMVIINQAIDALVARLVSDRLDRTAFIALPHAVSREVMAAWLRHYDVTDFTKLTVERLVQAAKTLSPGKAVPALAGWQLEVQADQLEFRRIPASAKNSRRGIID